MKHQTSSHRPGSALVLVLGTASLVTVIGIAGLTINRLNSRTTSASQDVSHARIMAQSAVDLGVWGLANNPSWRSMIAHDKWADDTNYAGALISTKYVDEIDGDLSNNNHDPVRVYGRAKVGQAVRIYSMVLTPPVISVQEIRVASATDDAEEDTFTGNSYHHSADLDLVWSGASDLVGVRFTNVTIPQGAVITNAYIQFTTYREQSDATSLWIQGEDTDDAQTFDTTPWNIGSRFATAAFALWDPDPWNTVGEAGVDQRTPDISEIISEIISRPGWSSGNALMIAFGGAGLREAVAYDSDPTTAPLLHIEGALSRSLQPVQGTWRREPN